MTRYWVTFGGLLVLTTATLLLSFVPLGAFHVPVALAIAAGKSVLIALFFMHLVEQRHTNWMVFVIGVLLLALLVSLATLDVLTRGYAVLVPAAS